MVEWGASRHLASRNPNYFVEIPDLPSSGQTISEIAETPWNVETLVTFEKEREAQGIAARSLKQLVLDMEDEVLANAGVDVFEEVFKLIFTKLYDELSVYQGRYKHLRFRNTNTAAELRQRINQLLADAPKKWGGVFPDDDHIKLTPGRLHHKSGSDKDLFEVGFVPAGSEAFVLDADFVRGFVFQHR